jgi:Effector-associated domain 11
MKPFLLKLIADGKLKEALDWMQKVEHTQNSYFKNELSNYSSRFKRNEKDRSMSVISVEEHRMEYNKIEDSVKKLLDSEFDEKKIPANFKIHPEESAKQDSAPPPKTAPTPFFTSKYLIWLGGGLTMIAFLFNLTSGSGNSSIKTSTTNTIFELDGTYNGGTAMIDTKGDNLTVKLHDNRPIANGRILSVYEIIVDFSDHHEQTGKLVTPNRIRWDTGTEWVKDKTP